jgi:hypothetical protein
MAITHTEADFEQLSWHDCHVWGVAFIAGDPEEQDWTSDPACDIDFIVEWLCPAEGCFEFRVAPARLVFHGVTDPTISINWGDSGFQCAIHLVSIDRIHREQVNEQKVYLDRPYYRWRIALNWPANGEITFGAVGFTQTLLADPVLTEKQHLSRVLHSRLTRT